MTIPNPKTQASFYDGINTKRLIAFIIDSILIAVMVTVMVVCTAFLGLFFLPILFAITSFIYRVLTLKTKSATIGMRIMAIELRTARGEKFDLGMSVLHTGLFFIWTTTVILQIISIALMLLTEKKQGLSDLILGSVTINSPTKN